MVTRRYGLQVAAIALMAVLVGSPHARAVDQLADFQDAYVAVDRANGEWTIGNDRIRYTLHARRDGTISLAGLTRAGSSDPVTSNTTPDALVTLGGEAVRLGAGGSGFLIQSLDASTGTHFVALTVRFARREGGLVAIRHYVVYPHTAAVEVWTSFESTDGETHTIENLNAYSLDLIAGPIEVVSGLGTPDSDGGPFTRQSRTLGDGEHVAFGSPTLSTETDAPYFSVGDSQQRVFSGLLWSGAWSVSLDRQDDAVHVELGLPPMSAWVRPGQPIEGPHAFVGAVLDLPGADTAAVTAFVRAGRAGRALPALTTFNTWFVHGIDVNAATIRRDIDLAADVGIEQLQLDAGWYPREGPSSAFDFSNGLGTWEADPSRFPDGLGAVADYAHERGLKFGVWVEPERVWIDTVGRPGLAEEVFLAQQDGAYLPGTPNEEARDAQLCLADPRARAWVLDRLIRLIDEARPDNLKWDVNRWITCNRPGHGHPTDGGNYAHTQALYEILAALRQRYPHLTIENCAGGGHRLDFGLARLTDSAWMDDRTSPSAHVRRNLQGLLSLFPAEYLFSYVMAHPDEPIRGADDIPLLVRSRMPGMVGLATDLSELGEREKNELYQQFTLVKSLRELQAQATTYVLTPQRPGPGEWEVLQQVLPGSGVSFIFAFSTAAADSTIVSLREVQPDRTYQLRSADRGTIGRLRGSDLLAQGFEITRAPESAAQVLVLEPIDDADRARVQAPAIVLPAFTSRGARHRVPAPREN
jgi:alpha-galactosidase